MKIIYDVAKHCHHAKTKPTSEGANTSGITSAIEGVQINVHVTPLH